MCIRDRKDDSQANKAEVEKIEGVKGAFTNSGQFQIIIGQGAVNKVYEAFVGGGDIQPVSYTHLPGCPYGLDPVTGGQKIFAESVV